MSVQYYYIEKIKIRSSITPNFESVQLLSLLLYMEIFYLYSMLNSAGSSL